MKLSEGDVLSWSVSLELRFVGELESECEGDR